MDKQPLERITYSHYNPKRGGHVYDVSGTRIFISSHEIQNMPPDIGHQARLGDELLRRAKEQRAKERVNSAVPESHAYAYTTMQIPAFPGEGDNFVKLGKIAEEIVGGMTKSKAQAIVDAASARAFERMREDAQHFGCGFVRTSRKADGSVTSEHVSPNDVFNTATEKSGDGKPLVAMAQAAIREPFPVAALERKHVRGGLFVGP